MVNSLLRLRHCRGLGRVVRRWAVLLVVACSAVLWLQPVASAEPLSEYDLFHDEQSGATALVVAHVYFSEEQLLNELSAALDVWEVHYGATAADHYVVAMLSQGQVEAFRTLGIRVEIDEAKTAGLNQEPALRSGQQGGITGYACYRTVEETYADLAALAVARPDLAVWRDIGDSWNLLHPDNEPGYDLNVLVLTNRILPGPKPAFFMMAAIHARELTTAEVATRFAEELVTGYGQDPDITWLLDHTEIHILPIANPDGRKWAEQLLYWRKNTNRNDGCTAASPFLSYYGVDLNRNSSFKWNGCEGQGCSTDLACRDTFRGSAPASEPETQAIQNYVSSLFADRRGPGDNDAAPLDTPGLLISVHSYSNLVLYPWGWRQSPSPNHNELRTLGQKFGFYTGYRVCQSGGQGCLYMTDGTTDDWAYGELGVAAYTFELGNAFFERCDAFEETISPNTLAALLYAAKAARQPYQTPAGPESIQLAATPARILSGTPISLTAVADDTRRLGNNGDDDLGQPISRGRYSLNSPSWITGALTVDMAASDGLLDSPVEQLHALIDTTGWPVGRQLLLVESQDQTGAWGAPSGLFVDVLLSPYGVTASAAPLSATLPAGRIVTVTVAVTNTGLASDQFALTAVTDRLDVSLPAALGPLEPLQAGLMVVTVSAPATATATASLPLTLTVTSLANSDTQAQLTVFLTIEVPTDEEEANEPAAQRLFLPWISRP